MSSRVEDRCNQVLERLKKKIREINERPANSPIPSHRPIVRRPTANSEKEKKKKEKEQEEESKMLTQTKKRARPTSNDNNTDKKRARTVEEDEEKEMEIEGEEEGREDQLSFALPKIVASTAALSTPTSITKKKKKNTKKKSVRFNLNLNTTHFVPFKEKSTLRNNEPSGPQLSRAEAQLLAKKKGVDGDKSLVFGVSTEIEWIVPALVGGFTPTVLDDKSEIERMQERRVRYGEGKKYKVSSREKPPANPQLQDTNDKMKRIRFGKTVQIPVNEETDLSSSTTTTNSTINSYGVIAGKSGNVFLGMGFQQKRSEVCKYFNTRGGCQRGSSCNFLHIKK